MLTLNTSRPHQPSMYFQTKFPKDGIVLHFTAGTTADGAIATFEASPRINKYPMSVPYVMGNDPAATVYKLFDDEYWSYNLAITGSWAQSHKHDKRTVAVEIVNPGPLRKVGDKMCFWPKNWTAPYCSVSETDKYIEVPAYRGEKFFATFTPAQIANTVALCDMVCDKYGIPKVIPPAAKRMAFDMPYFDKFKGVFTHVNVRPDKWDLGPAGEAIWQALIAAGYKEA